MKEKEFIQKLKSKDEKILLSYILDKYHQYEKTGISTSSNFLNSKELSFLENSLTFLKIKYNKYQPGDSCDRSIVYFGEYNDFVSFYQINITEVRHTDVLGSLFGSGFTHSMIGDIFVLEDIVYITNLEKYNNLLEVAFTKIGKKPIKLIRIEHLPVIERKYLDLSILVNSTRLDLILSKLLKISRKDSLEYLKKKRVLLNYTEIDKTKNLKEGDILSIEGFGKVVVKEIVDSKKGLKIIIKKYC